MQKADWQRWIDGWAHVFIDGDFDGYRARCHLPFYYVLNGARRAVELEKSFRKIFDAYRVLLLAHQVNMQVLTVQEAFDQGDRVDLLVTDRALSDGRVVFQEDTQIVMNRISNRWQMVELQRYSEMSPLLMRTLSTLFDQAEDELRQEDTRLLHQDMNEETND